MHKGLSASAVTRRLEQGISYAVVPRGELHVNMKKDATVQTIEVHVDGQRIAGDIIKNIQAGVKYEVLVKLPL